MTTTMLASSSRGGVSCYNGRGCCRRRIVTAQGRSLASGVLVSLAGLMRISAKFVIQGSGCSGGLSTVHQTIARFRFGDGYLYMYMYIYIYVCIHTYTLSYQESYSYSCSYSTLTCSRDWFVLGVSYPDQRLPRGGSVSFELHCNGCQQLDCI